MLKRPTQFLLLSLCLVQAGLLLSAEAQPTAPAPATPENRLPLHPFLNERGADEDRNCSQYNANSTDFCFCMLDFEPIDFVCDYDCSCKPDPIVGYDCGKSSCHVTTKFIVVLACGGGGLLFLCVAMCCTVYCCCCRKRKKWEELY
ncbi:hypothetical protein QOT17_016250 [Balamuthia mandrillaris]